VRSIQYTAYTRGRGCGGGRDREVALLRERNRQRGNERARSRDREKGRTNQGPEIARKLRTKGGSSEERGPQRGLISGHRPVSVHLAGRPLPEAQKRGTAREGALALALVVLVPFISAFGKGTTRRTGVGRSVQRIVQLDRLRPPTVSCLTGTVLCLIHRPNEP